MIYALKDITSRKIACSVIFAAFFSVCQVIGYFFKIDDPKWLAQQHAGKFILFFVATFIVVLVITWLIISFIDFRNIQNNKVDIINEEVSGRSALMSSRKKYIIFFFLFLLCWAPYVIIFSPGVVVFDSLRMILMDIHLPTRHAGQLITDGVNVIYSNVSPVLLTWIFGFFTKLGTFLGNINTGILIYVIFLNILSAAAFTWGLAQLELFKARNIVKIIYFLFYAFYPLISLNMFVMFSDNIFALELFVLTVLTYKIIYTKGGYLEKKSSIVIFILLNLALVFTRKTGLFISLALCILLMICFGRKYIKQLIFCILCVILIFSVGFETMVYDALNVNKENAKEYLSIPFQQTARFLRDYTGEITDEEVENIDKVLDADVIGERYYPYMSDKVKHTFKQESTGEDLQDYFCTWFLEFKKSSSIYAEALFYQTSQYFYVGRSPFAEANFKIYGIRDFYDFYYTLEDQFDLDLDDYKEYNFKLSSETQYLREKLENGFDKIKNAPVLGYLFSIGLFFQGTIFLFIYSIYKRRYKMMVPLAMLLIIALGCLFSPVNGSYRYAMPVIYCSPFCLLFLFTKAAQQASFMLKKNKEKAETYQA